MNAEFRWEGSDLVMGPGNQSVTETMEVVVDMNDLDGPVGIEILGIVSRHPQLDADDQSEADLPMSVDADADASYIRLGEQRSDYTILCDALLGFDAADRLVAVRIPIQS